MAGAASSPDSPETWGAASRGYADKVAPTLMYAYVEEFVDRLQVEPDHAALEVAAGSGALTVPLARRAQSVLATDFAPKMLAILRERVAELGLNNVTCALMDGQSLEVEDASFDRAACCFGLMLFPNRAKGFAELRRSLRPGGRAMVSGWAGPDRFESFGLFMAAMKSALPDLPPPSTPPPVFNLSNLEAFKAEMEAAGFHNVEVDHVTREAEVADFDRLWDVLTAGAPPVQMLFDRVGAQGKERIREALLAIVNERFGNGPIRTTNVATVGCGDVR